MPRCPVCGKECSSGARFCRSCGARLGGEAAQSPQYLPPRDLRGGQAPLDWLSLDDVIYTRDKRFGAIGVLLAFFGAFAPWASTPVSFMGIQVGSYGVNSPQAWLIAVAAVAAGVLLFRPRSGSIVMVMGIIIAAWTVLFALTTLSGQASPSWGVALTLAGGGLLAYSGHLTNRYEGGS